MSYHREDKKKRRNQPNQRHTPLDWLREIREWLSLFLSSPTGKATLIISILVSITISCIGVLTLSNIMSGNCFFCTFNFNNVNELSADERFTTIPILQGEFWPNGQNLGLSTIPNSTKKQYLNGIPFEVGRQVNTLGCGNSNYGTTLSFQTSISDAKNVYILMQGGDTYVEYVNRKVGQIDLHFANNEPLATELIIGNNIRDWTRNYNPAQNIINTGIVSLMDVPEAWGNAQGREGGMDILLIPITNPQTLQTINIFDTSEITMADVFNDPCLHIQAITVEQDI